MKTMVWTQFEIDDALKEKYEELRFSKSPGILVVKIEDEKIILERDEVVPFDEFKETLPDDEPRFVLFDAPVKNRVGVDDKRMVFIFWMPMEAPVKLRMTYAGAKNYVRDVFQGISTTLQFDDKSEMSLETIQKRVMKTQGINV